MSNHTELIKEAKALTTDDIGRMRLINLSGLLNALANALEAQVEETKKAKLRTLEELASEMDETAPQQGEVEGWMVAENFIALKILSITPKGSPHADQ